MATVRLFVLAGFACLAAVLPAAPETHADEVVATILGNVAKLKAARPDAVPMAFWDFDGTIIKGDVSEGLDEDGVQKFKGLIEETILAGLSTTYKGPEGWLRYRDRDYPRLKEIGRWLAWPYNGQIYRGVSAAALDAFCERKYDETYRHWYFSSAMKIMRALEKAGVENYVVSASPEIFVRNSDRTLGLPRERLRAIRIAIDAGYMTTKIIYPVPYDHGKVENVRELVLARPHGVAVAGFGNSYSTDGEFLKYIVTQSLPGGAKGFALMINGGAEREGYKGLFRLVNQDETTGSAAR
jgi:hypothetical protein